MIKVGDRQRCSVSICVTSAKSPKNYSIIILAIPKMFQQKLRARSFSALEYL